MTCKFCGCGNPESAKYCGNCGCKLEFEKKRHRKGVLATVIILVCFLGILCSLMLFRNNNNDVQQETTCQHEWQNNGVTSICTKCRGVIITPTEDKTSKETTNQNAVAQEKEKRVSSITQYSGDEVSVVTMYDYDTDGNLLCVERKNWYNGENNYTITTDYIYNADGQLIAKKDADAPINDVEYIYDGNIRTGYVENTYWLYDDGSYQLENSVEYAYVRDSNGNVIEKTTVNPQQELWTTGTYSYDVDNHLIAAYEEQRSGDHHFKLKYSFDYSYKGLTVVSCKGTVSAYDYSDTIVILSDLSCGPVSVELYLTEDVNLITDEEGYITEIRNSDNELVCEVSYALNQMLKTNEEAGEGNSAEATESLISFLTDYEKEYGDLLESYFTFDGTPSFSPAILEDVDADGEKELILHTFPFAGYDEDSVYGPQVEQYAVYGYHGDEWTIEKEPQVIGSISYPGFSGHAGVLQKDGKPLLYTHEWKAPYGTSEGPGVEFTYLITVYDSKYSVDATFAVIKRWEGELDESPYKEIVEYEINGKQVSFEKFIDTISTYDGIYWDVEYNWFDFDTDVVTVDSLIGQLM